jgi:hypothetical protein
VGFVWQVGPQGDLQEILDPSGPENFALLSPGGLFLTTSNNKQGSMIPPGYKVSSFMGRVHQFLLTKVTRTLQLLRLAPILARLLTKRSKVLAGRFWAALLARKDLRSLETITISINEPVPAVYTVLASSTP